MRLGGVFSALLVALLPLTAQAGLFFGSTVCAECACSEKDSYTIDCSNRDLTDAYTASDTWPANKSNVRLLYDQNALVKVVSVPALDVTLLSYQSNDVAEVADGAFEKLPRLRAVDLSHNKLVRSAFTEHSFRGQFSATGYQPSPIQSLDLSYNAIHSIFEETFSHLSALTEIDLSHNPISMLDHHTTLAITSLGSVRTLRLAHTGLRRLPHGFLHSLNTLRTLDLAGNQLRQVPPELQNSHAILSLSLDANPIRRLGADSFRGMTRLETLNLSGLPLLESIDDDAFSTLTSLHVLRMRNNLRLKSISRHVFRGMETSRGLLPLRELFISGNNLTSLSGGTVPFWDQLLMVQLHDNPWRCDCRLRWMSTQLAPLLRASDPREAHQLLCQSPARLRGVPLLEAVDEGEALLCEPELAPHHSAGSGYTLAAALTIGGLVVIVCAAIVSYLIIRRQKLRQIYSERLWAAALVGTLLVMSLSVLFFWFVVAADRSGVGPPGDPLLLRLMATFVLFVLLCGVASFFVIRFSVRAAKCRAKQQIRYRRAALEEEAACDDLNPAVTIRS